MIKNIKKVTMEYISTFRTTHITFLFFISQIIEKLAKSFCFLCCKNQPLETLNSNTKSFIA
jgi:hypothetical protein